MILALRRVLETLSETQIWGSVTVVEHDKIRSHPLGECSAYASGGHPVLLRGYGAWRIESPLHSFMYPIACSCWRS